MEESESVWAVVVTAGGKFIGKVHGAKEHSGNASRRGMALPASITSVMQHWGEHGWIKMDPTYEYHVMMSPAPGGALQRHCAALPLGACSKGVPMRLVPSGIIFFEEMEEEDQKTHKDLVNKAREMAEVTRRAAGSGLQVAQEHQVPGLRGGPGFQGPPGRG